MKNKPGFLSAAVEQIEAGEIPRDVQLHASWHLMDQEVAHQIRDIAAVDTEAEFPSGTDMLTVLSQNIGKAAQVLHSVRQACAIVDQDLLSDISSWNEAAQSFQNLERERAGKNGKTKLAGILVILGLFSTPLVKTLEGQQPMLALGTVLAFLLGYMLKKTQEVKAISNKITALGVDVTGRHLPRQLESAQSEIMALLDFSDFTPAAQNVVAHMDLKSESDNLLSEAASIAGRIKIIQEEMTYGERFAGRFLRAKKPIDA